MRCFFCSKGQFFDKRAFLRKNIFFFSENICFPSFNMCSSSANICSKFFTRFSQGAPTGVCGLVTREVGKKTAPSKQNICAVACKFEVWGFRKRQSEWPLYPNIKYLVSCRGSNFDKTGTLELKSDYAHWRVLYFRTGENAPISGLQM